MKKITSLFIITITIFLSGCLPYVESGLVCDKASIEPRSKFYLSCLDSAEKDDRNQQKSGFKVYSEECQKVSLGLYCSVK